MIDAEAARRLIRLVDLTSLGISDDEVSIRALASRARGAPIPVAALCTWRRLASSALHALDGSTIPLCVVANFPEGGTDLVTAAEETRQAVAAGAGEVDVVFPWRALLEGDAITGQQLIRACREACGPALLKVILESGQFAGNSGRLRQAAEIAAEAGADFLKTSTGKAPPGATPEGAGVLIAVVAEARAHGGRLGFKVSGGVRSSSQALAYLEQFEQACGPGSADPTCFRIGASALFDELLLATGELA